MPKGYPNNPKFRSLGERFWSKATLNPSTGCIEWTSYKNKDGYGSFWFDGRMVAAHRVAYAMANGMKLVPSGRFAGRPVICHRCDNPSCVNPNHLFLGTDADNARDRNAKGRGHIGGAPKISGGTVAEIRLAYASGDKSQRELAQEFGLSQSQIGNIVRRSQWRHVDA